MEIEPKQGETIVVWFSCGAASAVAAKMTIEKYGKTNIIRVVNNPIKEEDEDNQRFLKDCEKWLGVKIESAINSKYKSCSIVEVFEDQNFMANVGRQYPGMTFTSEPRKYYYNKKRVYPIEILTKPIRK